MQRTRVAAHWRVCTPLFFFFSSRRRHTRCSRDWSSDVCSSDLEYVRDAFPKYKITYVSLVPLVLKNLQKGLEARLDALPAGKRRLFNALVAINKEIGRASCRERV